MGTIDEINKIKEEISGEKGLKAQIQTNTTWITQATVKLNILFGVLTFLGITFGGLIITLIWEILTHKIVLGF
jgi:uncharacterized membrane protein SpoIIM required for sporulation